MTGESMNGASREQAVIEHLIVPPASTSSAFSRLALLMDFRRGKLIFEEHLLAALVMLLFAHAIFAWSVGFANSISDLYGFRQAQTAIAVQSLLDGGPRLLYQIPIFGPPWAFPLEFPLYQWITAALVWLTRLPLIETGRAVSIFFFLVVLAACWKVLAALSVEKKGKLAITAVLLASPIYLFWARTFMIETCSLALALWYLYYAIESAKRPHPITIGICTALGVLASLVKITTFLPVLLLAFGWLVYFALKRQSSIRSLLLPSCFIVLLPAIAGVAWTEFASKVDNKNILVATFMQPSQAGAWVFGNLADRFSPALWSALGDRIVPDAIGALFAVVILFALLPSLRRYAAHAIIASALFLLPVLVSPILHIIHTYYQVENAYFLSVCAGFVAGELMAGRGGAKAAGWILLLFVVCAGISRYYSAYYAYAHENHQRMKLVGDRVQSLTTPKQLIVVKGEDWSSEVPFYAHRRAIMDRDFSPELLHQQIAAAFPAQVGDVLFCDTARREIENLDVDEKLEKVSQLYGVKMSRSLDDGICFHLTNAKVGRPLNSKIAITGSLPFLSFLDLPQSGAEVTKSFITAGWVLSLPLTKEIDVDIDGKPVATGETGTIRLDLQQPFPNYPGHPFNGFNIQVSSKGLSAGSHLVTLHAILEDGSDHFLGQATISKR